MEDESVFGKIKHVVLEEEMKKSYIDYAMSVIVQRALPDVRDGLKPVHRRILYAMNEAGMLPNKPYKKSARIVGEVLGKYHPHGDSSVYDAIVRLAQDFSTRYLMVDGHGNFGSVDGDGAAAMRYTEVRMGKIAEEMLRDIEKDTVDFIPNYDESLKEPTVLPSKVPAILINGSAGIAVGMATNIPPHNLGEVVDGLVALIENPEISIDGLMHYIKGPDFPTGAEILGVDGIRKAYTTGRGVLKVRSKSHIEAMEGRNKDRKRIVITQIPYQVNKARLIENIAQLVKDAVKAKDDGSNDLTRALRNISDLRDESDRKGMRIVIELREGTRPEHILNLLYKHSQLQDSFGVINLALVKGEPKILNLKQILVYYLEHQKEVVTRRTRYELAKAKEREHILAGLRIALDHIDEIITTIRESTNAEIARRSLMTKFGLSERQAQAILDMRLQRLTGLERQKIEDDYVNILALIDDLTGILADEQRVLEIVKTDLLEAKRRYADARRTAIVVDEGEFDIKDLVPDTDIVVTISQAGYIKRQELSNFRPQRRGGNGVKGSGGKKDDESEHLLVTTAHKKILLFTNKGRVYQINAYDLPDVSRQAKGIYIYNLLPQMESKSLSVGEATQDKRLDTRYTAIGAEKVTALIAVDPEQYDPNAYLFMATNKGVVKRTLVSEFSATSRKGIIAIKLAEDEELIDVQLTDGKQAILLATRRGMSIIFPETEVPSHGRASHGVKGINLELEDKVVSMDNFSLEAESEALPVVENEQEAEAVASTKYDKLQEALKLYSGEILTVTEKGLGKRTALSKYRIQSRGGKGLKNYKVIEKSGAVVGIKVITSGKGIMFITSKGKILWTRTDEIRKIGRLGQGVTAVKLDEEDNLVSLAIVDAKIADKVPNDVVVGEKEEVATSTQEE